MTLPKSPGFSGQALPNKGGTSSPLPFVGKGPGGWGEKKTTYIPIFRMFAIRYDRLVQKNSSFYLTSTGDVAGIS